MTERSSADAVLPRMDTRRDESHHRASHLLGRSAPLDPKLQLAATDGGGVWDSRHTPR